MLGKTFTHYRVTDVLGRGGMGEVYRAEDLKLGRTVALKFLSPEFVRDPQAKARFVQEAKAASALDHPNICTIHGIEETEDGRLFIAMACYQGQTLKDRIAEGPMEIGEVLHITIQAAHGLAKAHSLGIVHRDIKPANFFLTDDGLVKLLDFGIAKLMGQTQVTRPGALMGTVPYMSPEQVRGEEVDRRTDLWALGVVLYEMLSGQRPFDGDDPQGVLRKILELEPPALKEIRSDLPPELESVVAHCLRKPAQERLASADELLLQIKHLGDGHSGEVTHARTTNLRQLAEKRDVHPYPGLSSFTEADAEFFHGRESQVETLWRRIRDGRLLAVVGPSGVGKTSFLQAGLLPTKPKSWGTILTKPGGSPFIALREALVRELSGDTDAIVALLRENDLDTDVATVRRWRQRHDEGLLIFDQFEELFTLSPPQEQARFAELLSRITLEADVRVLISLRDDFLFHCQEHPGLAPVVDGLTLLTPLTGLALRRALTQPALDCGYAFEDDTLVEEMTASVKGERGALPLLSFTMASLWERRDREQGLLTRDAYEEIGAVSGALVQHAEAVMQEIGGEHHPIVRELFRNLVTAQGTRTVLDRDELISVFDAGERTVADEILGQLIDARLLTTYEIKDEDGSDHHRVEIVHESLLHAWPRLVRWQTQEAEGAQLRDQLRQASQLWEQKSRSDDLLWTGTAYREFELWRERYPGGISESEEAFSRAMHSRDTRERRRRRIAVAGAFVTLLVVLAVVSVFGERARQNELISEARRLHMLAEAKMEEDNTVALALATASLEREDNPDVRQTALRALWHAPTRFVLALKDTRMNMGSAVLSPNGDWLATISDEGVLLWPRDGGEPRRLEVEPRPDAYETTTVQFHPQGDLLVAQQAPRDPTDLESPKVWTLWSVPDGRRLHTWQWLDEEGRGCFYFPRGDPPVLLVAHFDAPGLPWRWLRFSLDDDHPQVLGPADTSTETAREFTVDAAGRYLLDWKGTGVYLFPLDSLETSEPILVGHHEREVFGVAFSHDEDLIASADKGGEVRVWSRKTDGDYELSMRRQTDEQMIRFVSFDRSASRVRYQASGTLQIGLLNRASPQAEPTLLLPVMGWPGHTSFSPDDSWIVFPRASNDLDGEVFFYSLTRRRPLVFDVLPEKPELRPGTMHAQGTRLVAATVVSELWLCEVLGEDQGCARLWRHPQGRTFFHWRIDPTEQYVLVNNWMGGGEAWLIPLDGGDPRALGGFSVAGVGAVAFSSDGGKAAVGGQARAIAPGMNVEDAVIRVWDLETDEVQVLESGGEAGFYGIWFLPEERLVSAGPDGLRLWDLETGQHETLSEREYLNLGGIDAECRHLVIDTPLGVTVWDLEERTERILPIPSDGTWSLAMSPDARFLVAGMAGGEVIVQFLDEEEPHLLLGHDGSVTAVWISPDSDEIRSASKDGTVRVWQVPEGKPLQTLPREELLDILRAQTNLRIVTDPDAEDGYRIVYDDFPGWENTPPGW